MPAACAMRARANTSVRYKPSPRCASTVDPRFAANTKAWIEVEDEGRTLLFEPIGDAKALDVQTYSLQGAACILDELRAPSSVVAKIDDTNALMGRQEDSWGDYEISWSYHPDNGLTFIIETAH